MNGKGVYDFSDGGRYIGEFKDGKFDGKGICYKISVGIFYYPNGDKYEGDWRSQKRNGVGNLP